jgi:hypothetical protein
MDHARLERSDSDLDPEQLLFTFAAQCWAVLRILIHRIHMFLGLPDPDPLVRCMDPDPLWIRILLSSCKNSKKNLGS